ncbi:VanZ family protein [Sinorhizobium medicae]|uniref:VanZ family protein n=1 Tax=Sinorhizobium medicae TaxID=110321 RepID=UPI001294FA46|nr:VanZ family protein [Sinorhizobium medicae]MQV99014.1 VanZ family protein [Sinorhizobium medicae]
MNLRRIASLLAWSLLCVIAYSTLSPHDLRPHMGSSVQIERFGAFGLTGLMFAVAYPRRLPSVLAIVLAAAVGLEFMQMLAADRHARLIDLAVKVAGGGCGVAAGWLLVRQWQRSRPEITGINRHAKLRG